MFEPIKWSALFSGVGNSCDAYHCSMTLEFSALYLCHFILDFSNFKQNLRLIVFLKFIPQNNWNIPDYFTAEVSIVINIHQLYCIPQYQLYILPIMLILLYSINYQITPCLCYRNIALQPSSQSGGQGVPLSCMTKHFRLVTLN